MGRANFRFPELTLSFRYKRVRERRVVTEKKPDDGPDAADHTEHVED